MKNLQQNIGIKYVQQHPFRLWEFEEAPLNRVIDVYIKNLRKKLHLDCIKTVKGVGYKYEALRWEA